jgi:HEAT repeat protein
MRVLVLLSLALACGNRTGATTGSLAPSGPPLPPPPPVDPNARGAAYLAALAAQIQPAWGQFLEDCRLRLPKEHPLNQRGLAAVAELVIARDGRVVPRMVTGSGNGDFDTAVVDVLGDVSPLPPPPPELASDDDHVHLQWLFARDSRQAGAATAQVKDVRLPLLGVVEKLLARKMTDRAARRIALAPVDDPDRIAASERVFTVALREALQSPSGGVRRAAVEAIGRAQVHALASEIHLLVSPHSDLDLRVAAITAAGQLGDPAVVPGLARDLAHDFGNRPRIAIAKIEALVALGRGREAISAIKSELANAPTTIGLAALALVPDPDLAPKLATWMGSKDAQIRAAVCGTLPVAVPARSLALLARGMRDPDAGVRAACIANAVRASEAKSARKVDATVLRLLRELARDRDRTVRARAIAALGIADPGHRYRAIDDPAAEVRAASVVGAGEADLRTLAGDRDPEVRAAALAQLGDRAPELATRAVADLSAAVRRVAIGILVDDVQLERLSTDPSPEVATTALVKLAMRRGRVAMTSPLLAGFAASPKHGPERVRIALAWLLAR